MIDLHTHSTFSDGTLTPQELAARAAKVGLSAVALTDHDCTDGVPFLLAECERQGITGIAGVEISADVPSGTMHVLGYFVDLDNAVLQDALREIRGGRLERNHKILRRLNELGLELTWDEVAACAGEDVVGRPHFSAAMIARGYVRDKAAAFNSYLGKGRSAYVDRFRLTPKESLAAIRDAGGVPVLAHPFSLRMGGADLAACVKELAGFGLGGIEVLYPLHRPAQVRAYTRLARTFDLVVTGGADFHGSVTPDVEMGRGFGSLNVPDEIVGLLQARCPS